MEWFIKELGKLFNEIKKFMTSISVNGTMYQSNNITVSNINGKRRVIINGNDVTPDDKQIDIRIQGDVNIVDISACDTVTISGDVKKVSTASGDIKCGNVDGEVKTMSGDITCGSVGGNVKTMSGDVKIIR